MDSWRSRTSRNKQPLNPTKWVATAHYAVYLACMSWIADWHMPFPLVRHTFIETGTYHGQTLASAAQQPFKRLVTIDVDAAAQAYAQTVLGPDPRITYLLGSSATLLPAVMHAAEPTTFWLDAHFTGHPDSKMDPNAGECALLNELTAIQIVPWHTPPIILIDDAFMFDRARGWWQTSEHAKAFKPSHWPTLEAIRAALPGFTLHVGEYVITAYQS